jgi:3-methyl-2-oxobutanoate hydroxymethyltransferase
LQIPTIGIASGPHCAGQVLVMHDLLGMHPDFRPQHAKVYIDLFKKVSEAVHQYITEVKEGDFPIYPTLALPLQRGGKCL